MDEPDYKMLQNRTAPLEDLLAAMGFPHAAGVTFAEAEARAEMLAQEVMISFQAGKDRDTLIQNLEAICTAVKARATSPAPPAHTASTPLPASTPTPAQLPPSPPAATILSPVTSTPPAPAVPPVTPVPVTPVPVTPVPVTPVPVSPVTPQRTAIPFKKVVLIGLASLILLPVSCIGLASVLSGGKGNESTESKPPAPPVDPDGGADATSSRPESGAEKTKRLADAITGKAMEPVPGIIHGARKSWVEFNIADDANLWIWIHIKEGNYEKSPYDSAKGYTSFKACLRDVNPNLIDGKGTYTYNFTTNESAFREGKFPEVTENVPDEQQVLSSDGVYRKPMPNSTLLAAVILSRHPSTIKVAMLKDLVDRGADVNQRFGPDGTTALMLAAQQDDQKVIAYLVNDAKAEVAVKDLQGSRAFDFTQSDYLRKMLN